MECAMIEDEIAMCKTMLNISKKVEIVYETLPNETEEKEWLPL